MATDAVAVVAGGSGGGGGIVGLAEAVALLSLSPTLAARRQYHRWRKEEREREKSWLTGWLGILSLPAQFAGGGGGGGGGGAPDDGRWLPSAFCLLAA